MMLPQLQKYPSENAISGVDSSKNVVFTVREIDARFRTCLFR
jgi:hypothetical protein